MRQSKAKLTKCLEEAKCAWKENGTPGCRWPSTTHVTSSSHLQPTTGCLPTCLQPASIKTIVLIVIKMEQKNVWQQRAHWMIEFVVRLSPPSDLRIILYYGDSSGYGALHWNLTQRNWIPIDDLLFKILINHWNTEPLVGWGGGRIRMGLKNI